MVGNAFDMARHDVASRELRAMGSGGDEKNHCGCLRSSRWLSEGW
jgi:hypothetical protein